jgi:hypothetical protein
MGLGGVMAASGGLGSIVAILWFAMLSKFSFDLLIDLSEGGSYEDELRRSNLQAKLDPRWYLYRGFCTPMDALWHTLRLLMTIWRQG